MDRSLSQQAAERAAAEVSGIPLSHGGPDVPEHGPSGLIGDSDLAGQQDGRDPALVLEEEIEGQEPLWLIIRDNHFFNSATGPERNEDFPESLT